MASARRSLRAVPDNTFASLLKMKRQADGLTQAALGDRLQVRQQTIGAWESGDRPQARFLTPIAEYLRLEDRQVLVDLLDNDPVTAKPVQPTEPQAATTPSEYINMITETLRQRSAWGPLSAAEQSLYSDLFTHYRAQLAEQ